MYVLERSPTAATPKATYMIATRAARQRAAGVPATGGYLAESSTGAPMQK